MGIEGRRQKTDDRGQRSDVEVRSQKTENSTQMTWDRPCIKGIVIKSSVFCLLK
jgi:hypothetical protein